MRSTYVLMSSVIRRHSRRFLQLVVKQLRNNNPRIPGNGKRSRRLSVKIIFYDWWRSDNNIDLVFLVVLLGLPHDIQFGTEFDCGNN